MYLDKYSSVIIDEFFSSVKSVDKYYGLFFFSFNLFSSYSLWFSIFSSSFSTSTPPSLSLLHPLPLSSLYYCAVVVVSLLHCLLLIFFPPSLSSFYCRVVIAPLLLSFYRLWSSSSYFIFPFLIVFFFSSFSI